jgi:Domain of unknown function (DUF4157)
MNTRSPTQTKQPRSFTPVSTGLVQRKCTSCGQHTMAGGECAECRQNKLTLQRHSNHQHELSEVPPIVDEVLRSPGQSLDAGIRAFMESHFRHDFSRVRVHTDSEAAESAQAVNALAYTTGHHIVFTNNNYAPETLQGQQLLAHELTHVVQQSKGSGSSLPLLKVADSASIQEREAHDFSSAVMPGYRPLLPTPSDTPLSLQKQPKNTPTSDKEKKPQQTAIPLSPKIIPKADLAITAGLPDKAPSAQPGTAGGKGKSEPEVEASVKAGQELGETPEVTTNIEVAIPLNLGRIPRTPIIIGKSVSLEVSNMPYLYGSGYRKLALDASIKLLSLELESSRYGSLDLATKAGVSQEYKSQPPLGQQEAAQTSELAFKAGIEAEYKPPVQVLGLQPFLYGSVGFKVKASDREVDVRPTSDLKVEPTVGGGIGVKF